MLINSIRSVTGIAVTIISSSAQAGTPGYITSIGVNTYGVGYVIHGGTRNTSPPCQSKEYSNRLVVNTANPAGQSVWATILSSYHSHKEVTINGLGTCTIWNDSETILEVISN